MILLCSAQRELRDSGTFINDGGLAPKTHLTVVASHATAMENLSPTATMNLGDEADSPWSGASSRPPQRIF